MWRWLGVCASCWSDHFPYCERRGWAHRFPTCISACVSPTSHACSMERKDLVLGSEQEEGSDHRQVFGRSEEFIVGTFAGCVVCRTVKRRPREDAADPVSFNSIRGTPRRLFPDDEPREPREPREQPLRLDVRLVHVDFPPPINTELSKPRRVHNRNSVELVRTLLGASAVKQQ